MQAAFHTLGMPALLRRRQSCYNDVVEARNTDPAVATFGLDSHVVTQGKKSVAIIGASETTLWTYWAIRNLKAYGFEGEIWPVNPNRDEVYGVKTFASIDALPGVPEAAILVTAPARAIAAAEQLVGLGTKEIICVADGFKETATDEGRELEAKLKAIFTGTDARLIGPNCVGYGSFTDNFVPLCEPLPLGIVPGDVSIISQSGVLTHSAPVAMQAEGLGIDELYSLGNSAAFNFADALQYLVDRPTTKIITAVVESVTDHDNLEKAISAGRKAGKEFIFLLMGQSEDGKRVAASHTGAVIGDQRVMRAWLEEMGVFLVDSFDQLTRTAALLKLVGRPSAENGVFLLTGSGGASGIAADTASAFGLPLAQITDETAAELRKHLLPGTTVGNPLDITSHGGREATKGIWDAIAADPNVGILIDPTGLSWPDDTDERRWHRAGMEVPVEVANRTKTPLIYSALMDQPMTAWVQNIIDTSDYVSVNTGFATTISSLAKLYDHSKDKAAKSHGHDNSTKDNVVDEAEARAILGGLGLPMVQGFVAPSAKAAGEGAKNVPAPWVAKVSVEGLAHKGRVGGVRLGLTTIDELVAACEGITDKVVEFKIAPREEVAFMVQEMVFGPEILVGLVRDAVAGPAVIVGVGGWAAEAGNLFAAIPLPASKEKIAHAINTGQLPKLIGEDKADQLIALLAELGTQFTTGDLKVYDTVEINPVIMAANGPKIADALLIK